MALLKFYHGDHILNGS